MSERVENTIGSVQRGGDDTQVFGSFITHVNWNHVRGVSLALISENQHQEYPKQRHILAELEARGLQVTKCHLQEVDIFFGLDFRHIGYILQMLWYYHDCGVRHCEPGKVMERFSLAFHENASSN